MNGQSSRWLNLFHATFSGLAFEGWAFSGWALSCRAFSGCALSCRAFSGCALSCPAFSGWTFSCWGQVDQVLYVTVICIAALCLTGDDSDLKRQWGQSILCIQADAFFRGGTVEKGRIRGVLKERKENKKLSVSETWISIIVVTFLDQVKMLQKMWLQIQISNIFRWFSNHCLG